MALTRANVEFLMEARMGPLMEAAGMAITVVGSNADMNDPIGHAIMQLGYAVADVTLVTNADVARVTDAQTVEFLAYAELHTLEAILGNLDDVDIKVGPRSEAFSQLARQVERKIARLRDELKREYGYGLPVSRVGYIRVDIAEHGT